MGIHGGKRTSWCCLSAGQVIAVFTAAYPPLRHYDLQLCPSCKSCRFLDIASLHPPLAALRLYPAVPLWSLWMVKSSPALRTCWTSKVRCSLPHCGASPLERKCRELQPYLPVFCQKSVFSPKILDKCPHFRYNLIGLTIDFVLLRFGADSSDRAIQI